MLEDLTKELELSNLFTPIDTPLAIHNTELMISEMILSEPSVMSLDELNALVLGELQATESSMESQVEKINAIEESVQSNLASIERCKRKHADAIQQCRVLLNDLPTEVSEEFCPETGLDFDALNVRAEAWMLDNNKIIEDDSAWRNIRRDWLEDLENPKTSTLQDLETMYTQMVNVEGVTSFAGNSHGTTTTSKHLLTSLLSMKSVKQHPRKFYFLFSIGKKAILVLDHRHCLLLSRTQHQGAEKKFKLMKLRTTVSHVEVNSKNGDKIFAEYFKEAHNSLKVTLLKQYRMHRQIMKSTNEFYEGKLECGLTDEDQKRLKQHGFHLRKKDSGGTFMLEGSDLITPDQHLVWVDST